MGFADELDAILRYAPANRQTLLFSATYPDSIAQMSERVQRKPVVVDVTDDEDAADITQHWCEVNWENRSEMLLAALRAWGGSLNLVFCNTKIDCAAVAHYLQSQNVAALALHGDLDQKQRNEMLVRFANRSANVLVATDVAARGLDVDDIDAVFNYELPPQAETYVHRIGRTARAGKKGLAVSLVDAREIPRLHLIQESVPAVPARPVDMSAGLPSRDLPSPAMVTIQISGGRKNKLRPGDILGAITAGGNVPGDAVGSIDLLETESYIAVHNEQAGTALRQLSDRPIKGRKYRARIRK